MTVKLQEKEMYTKLMESAKRIGQIAENNATWVSVGAWYHFEGEEMPHHILLAAKVSEFTVVNNWNSMGLRGPGSDTMIAKDLFISEDYDSNWSDKLNTADHLSHEALFLVMLMEADYSWLQLPIGCSFVNNGAISF